jgi:PAS domain S-box-containing protein
MRATSDDDVTADAAATSRAPWLFELLPILILVLGGALAVWSWYDLRAAERSALEPAGVAAETMILTVLLAVAVSAAQRASRRKRALAAAHRRLLAAMDERMRTEARLRESEDRFRQVVEHIGEVVWLGSAETHAVHYVSPAYERIWGRPRTSLYENPTSWIDAIHPDDREVAAIHPSSKLVDGAYDRRYRIVRPDGTVRWIRDRAFPIVDQQGTVRALAGLGEDVTSAKEREDALRRAREELELIVRAQPDLFIRIAGDGTILDIRPGGGIELAIPREQQLGMRVQAFVPAETAVALERAVVRLRAGSQVETVDYTLVTEDRIRRLEARLVALPDGETMGLVRDVTARHDAETLLKGERAIFEMVAKQAALPETLTECCRLLESLWPECLVAILLRDPATGRLQSAASASLPAEYVRAVDALAIDAAVGWCGAATRGEEPIICEDIASDPRWNDGRALASAHGLRACWSYPMLDEAGHVLGTFAVYHRRTKAPAAAERSVIGRLQQLATIAIELTRAEKALRTSEATYRRIVETSSEGLWEMDAENTTVFVNGRMAELLGYTVDEMMGRSVFDFLHPEQYANAERKIERRRQGLAERHEQQFQKKDGSHVWVQVSARPEFDEHGNYLGAFGMVTDVTERRRMEETLRLTEFAVARISDMMFLVAPDGRLLDANQSACRRLGYTRDELLALRVSDIDADIAPAQWPAVWAELLQRTSWRFEARHQSKSGEIYPVELACNYVEHEGRGYSYVIGRDITEERRSRAALVESEERLRLATEAGQTGTWDWNLQTNEVRFSNNLLTLFGLSTDFHTADWGDFLRAIAREDRPRIAELARSGRLNEAFEFRSVAPDGTVRWLANRGFVHRDPDGRPVRMVGTVVDVSARKQAELDREALLAEVRVANAMLTGLSQRLMDVQEDERRDLSRDLHDELGQCLTTVKINLQLLAERVPTVGREAGFEDTLALLDHMLAHVNRLCLELRPTLLDDLGLSAALRWYVHRQAERGRWTAQLQADELPTLPERIQVVCFRLVQEALTNVMRHAGASTVLVELRVRDGGLLVRVEDDGIGFEPGATKRAGLAGGLGLLGMQERLRAVDGELVIDSRPGTGTVLEARIRLHDAATVEAEPDVEPAV